RRARQEPSIWARVKYVENMQWWLWACAIVVTLLLTAGMASFSFLFRDSDLQYSFALRDSIRGLVALVFLFDLYTIYQQIEIHRIRRQLSEQEEMFRLISENADDLITVVNKEGKRLYNSPGYQRVFGYSNEELQGKPVVEQIHPDGHKAILAARDDVFQKGVSPRVEYRFRSKEGQWRTLESNGSPVRNRRGEIEKIVVVSRDVTERKQAEELLKQREEQLRQAQKMEAIGRLSGGIAHDFNNLLGVIIGYSEAMEFRLPSDDSLRKSVEEIRKAGERAAGLTHQLLAFSRQQVLQPKILDLNAVVTDIGKMLRRLIGVDIELITKLASQLGHVKADKSQIEQVIVNLVVNARDAMPDGGKLLIETSNVDISEDVARGLPFLHPGPHVLLTVADTGVGMDAETQQHVFEPFFTNKGAGIGTGLGLATVYGVVKQSGGVVGIDSEPGKGATFKIFLPQAQETVATSSLDVTDKKSSTGSGTVLLVEDEEALLNLTADLLSDSGYKVLTAHDGIQALEVAQSFDEPIHLLLTDVMMPKLGGPALARKLSQLRPDTRVLFMTGHVERGLASQSTIPSGAESLQKPFSRDILVRLVRQVLDAAPAQLSN
ncbi:MAG: PAS domain S-box protein, partial [Acidobacteriia bacterium]|nr:PAS domain S-box protein [Terriglobia bacterium]